MQFMLCPIIPFAIGQNSVQVSLNLCKAAIVVSIQALDNESEPHLARDQVNIILRDLCCHSVLERGSYSFLLRSDIENDSAYLLSDPSIKAVRLHEHLAIIGEVKLPYIKSLNNLFRILSPQQVVLSSLLSNIVAHQYKPLSVFVSDFLTG